MFIMFIVLCSAIPLMVYYFKFRKIQSRLAKSNNIRAVWTYLAAEDLIIESFKDDPDAMANLIFKQDINELLERTKKIKFNLYMSGAFYLAVVIACTVLGR